MDLRESIINQNDFTLGLTKQLLQTEGKHSNLVHLSLSIHVLLSLIAAGSKGPTQDKLLSFLKSNSTDHLKSLQPEKNHIVKRLFWKLKSQWKQGLGWRKSYNRYIYDLQSYYLNFDDGFDGHRS
ncbi:hypothetical protein ACFX2C_042799 [Malus domestica]